MDGAVLPNRYGRVYYGYMVHGMTSQQMQLEILVASTTAACFPFPCIQTFADDLFTPQQAI